MPLESYVGDGLARPARGNFAQKLDRIPARKFSKFFWGALLASIQCSSTPLMMSAIISASVATAIASPNGRPTLIE